MAESVFFRIKIYGLSIGVTMLLSLVFISNAQTTEIYAPQGVIELFTSQGCSSCPPADKFVTSLYRNKDILALSWHVDYWNYLGWKDVFSKPEHTKRQRSYSRSFGKNQMYTPQMVINGRSHVVGSRAKEIKTILQTHSQNRQGITVPIHANINSDQVLEIEISKGLTQITILYDV